MQFADRWNAMCARNQTMKDLRKVSEIVERAEDEILRLSRLIDAREEEISRMKKSFEAGF